LRAPVEASPGSAGASDDAPDTHSEKSAP